MHLMKRVGLATAGLLTSGALLAPAALADATCTITDNGAHSSNSCTIVVTNGSGGNCEQSCEPNEPKQIRRAKIKNKVRIYQNTGGNKANKNTGGNVTIETGNNTANVTITNDVNNN